MPTPRNSRAARPGLSNMDTLLVSDKHQTDTDLIDEYLNHLRFDKRPNTLRTRRIQLGVIARTIPVPLAAAEEQHIIEWHDQRDGKPETRASYTSAIKGFYRWLNVRKRARIDNPTAILDRPRIPKAKPRPMLDRNYELALACAVSNPELYIWLGLMGCSGFRCCEIAWIRVSDIEPRDDGAALAHIEGKGGKQRVVPIGANLHLTMRPFLRSPGPVFSRPSDGRPYTPSDISKQTNHFLHELGISETAHQMRHRFGSDYHALDADLYRQAKVMGHESIETTQLYTEIDPIEAARYIEMLTRRRIQGRRAA